MRKPSQSLLVAAFLLSFAPLALAEAPESYALTQMTKSPDGRQAAKTVLHAAPGKMRLERGDASERNPMPRMAVVTRKDNGVAWILFLDTKRYMEMAVDDPQLAQFQQSMHQSRKVESLGKESILGQDCEKKKVSNTVKAGSRTVDLGSTIWECDGFDIPLKIIGNQGAVTETIELTPGPQPDRLFEVPEGFEQVSNMIEGWGGRPARR